MREPHRFLCATHRGRNGGRIGHLHADRGSEATAVERLEGGDRHQDEAVEALTEHASFRCHHAGNRVLLAFEPNRLPDRIDTVKKILCDIIADHNHPTAFFHIQIGEWSAALEAIVLHALEVGGHTKDGRAAHGPVAPFDVGQRRGPARLQADGRCFGQGLFDHGGVGERDSRPFLDLSQRLVIDQTERDGAAAHLENVLADQRARDLLADIDVHAVDDRDHSDQKGHRHHDAEQREEGAKLVRAELRECGQEDVVEAHSSIITRAPESAAQGLR